MTSGIERVHATVATRRAPGPRGGWRGVLLLGPSGAGKSDLAVRLMERGWRLVADDHALAWASDGELHARAPQTIAGRIEVRGLGILETGGAGRADRLSSRIVLAARCVPAPPERLPEPDFLTVAGVRLPLVEIEALHASAPSRLEAALEALGQGRPLAY